MPRYPNQKRLKIHKQQGSAGNSYSIITTDAIKKLFDSGLTDRGVRLWLYFASNQDGFEIDMSPAHIQKECHISDSTFKRAKEDLIAAHYLVETDEKTLEFYDTPRIEWDF